MSNLPRISVIFFGSTSDSVIVLEKLFTFHFSLFTPRICAVVTQPPRPVGRKQAMTATPVELWAKSHGLPAISFPSDPQKPWLFADEATAIDTLAPFKADLLVSACYGQKIPWEAITRARYGGLNVHPSLLPRWRGADPVPWAILSGDHQTGVTVATLSKEFDAGEVIAQKKVPISDTDTSDPLRTKLFTLGTDLLIKVLPRYLAELSFPRTRESRVQIRWILGSSPRMTQKGTQTVFPCARRLTRDDGFEPWEAIVKAMSDPEEAVRIDRKFRAFHPWPGLWTKIGEKRLKILFLHLQPTTYNIQLDLVQLEGKKPVDWKQFHETYLTS